MIKPNGISAGKGSPMGQSQQLKEGFVSQAVDDVVKAKFEEMQIKSIPYAKKEIFDNDRIIPISSIDFDSQDYDALLDLFQARVFEYKLDQFIVTSAYDKVGSDIVNPAIERVDEQIEQHRARMAVARTLFESMQAAERSLIDPERVKQVQQRFNALNKDSNESTLIQPPPESEDDFFEALSDITNMSTTNLKSMQSSQLFVQILEDFRFYFLEGGSANIFASDDARPAPNGIVNGNIDKLYPLYSEIKGRKSIASTGLPKNNSGTDLVFNNAFARIASRSSEPGLKRIAQLCSQLANEFRISAGLGRVGGSQLASKFGVNASKENPFTNMLGGHGVSNVKTDSKTPGSLMDFAVVSSDGLTRKSKKGTNVSLFDAYVPNNNTKTDFVDAKTAFFDTVRNNPRDNNMESFDQVMMNAKSTFSDAEELLTMSTCSDLDLNLLSPHGLFIRVLEEFCNLTKFLGLEADQEAAAEQVTGLHMLYLAGATSDGKKDTFPLIMKRRLNMYAARLAGKRRTDGGMVLDKQVRLSSKELGTWFQGAIEEVRYDQRLIAQVLMGFSSDPSDFMKNSDLAFTNADAFKAAHHKNKGLPGFDGDFKRAIKISGAEILDVNKDTAGTQGFLRGVVDIFEELEKEAMAAAAKDGGSYTNLTRLTNNQGFDGALALGMILECFCLLARRFSKTALYVGGSNENGKVTSGHNIEGAGGPVEDGIHDLTNQAFSDVVTALRWSAFTTENASNHVGGANASDEFLAAFKMTDTGANVFNKIKIAQSTEAWEMAHLGTQPVDAALQLGGFAKIGGIDISSSGTGNMGDMSKILKTDANEYLKGVLTGIRHKLGQMFSAASHVILYEGGPGSKQDVGRQCLLEILAAAKAGDLNSLFEDPTDKNSSFLPAGGAQPFNGSMAKYSSFFTPAEVLDQIERLAHCTHAPMRFFNACQAMISHLDESTLDLSKKAAALRSKNKGIVHRGIKLTEPSEAEIALIDLASTKNGRDLIKLSSNRQLEIIQSRLAALESSDFDQGLFIEDLTDSTIVAMKMFLHSMKNIDKGKFMFFGLPAGKLEDLINNRNAEKIADQGYDADTFSPVVGQNLENTVIKFKMVVKDEIIPELKFKPLKEIKFPLNLTIDDAGIAVAFSGDTTPSTMNQLARFSEFTMDSPLTVETNKFLGEDLTPKYSVAELKAVLESFLIKKMTEVVFNQDINEKELIKNNISTRTSSESKIMLTLATELGIPEAAVKALFGNKVLTHPKLKNLIASAKKSGKSQMAKTDLLMTLFNTKPFFADSIDSIVGAPSEFDYVYAFFVDQGNFEMDVLATQDASESTAKFNEAFVKNIHSNILSNKNSFHLKSAFCVVEIGKRNVL